MLKKGDVILLLIVVFCILARFALDNESSSNSLTSWNSWANKGEIVAIIKKDNVIIQKINLSKLKSREIIYISGQYSSTIAADHNKICFLDSNCPDKICMKTGWLSKAGDLAVCLPNKTIIKIQKNIDLNGVVK